MGWMTDIKDAAISAGVRKFLASKLGDFGKIDQLTIDTSSRKIVMIVALEGEATPVEIRLAGYEIQEQNGVTTVSVPAGAFTASRPWLTKLLNSQLGGRPFKIPAEYAGYAKSLVG